MLSHQLQNATNYMKTVGHFLPAPLRRLRTLCKEKNGRKTELAYSIWHIVFFPQLLIQHHEWWSSLPVSLPQARKKIKKLIGLDGKGNFEKDFLWINFYKVSVQLNHYNQLYYWFDFSFPLFYWIFFPVDRQNLLLFVCKIFNCPLQKSVAHVGWTL